MIAELAQPSIRKTDGWRHQLEAFAFCDGRPASGLGMAMGTGKSWVAVNRICNLNSKLNLILAPKSVLRVWPRQFAQHAGREYPICVLDRGTVRQKTEEADRFIKRNAGGVLVINYESAWRPEFAQWSLGRLWDHVVADEVHRIKAHSGRASKYCDKLRPRSGNRLALSGTFMPHSPLDLFGSFRFLDVNVLGRWWTPFRSRYALTDRMFPSRVFKWINQDELNEKFHSMVFQVGADVLDLPPVLHEERGCQLSPQARKIYDELNDDLIAQVDSGVVTVANALVKLVRLQQITSGHLQDNEGGAIDLDETGKADLLRDLLEDLPAREPVVVFARFRHDLAVVRNVVGDLGRRYGELSGDRNDLTQDATMSEDTDVLGVQWDSGSLGVDLTRAAYAVIYSQTYNGGSYEQSLARLHRPGQTRPVRYYHLLAERTVDGKVYEALRKRKEVVNYVLQTLKRIEENQW